MNSRSFAHGACLLMFLTACGFTTFVHSADILPPGFRPKPVGVHALTGGKVVTKPGETLDEATIVIRDGYIEAVGQNVSVPPEARVWPMNGLTIYAGFIESYLPLSQTNQPVSTSATEAINRSSFTAGGVNFYGTAAQRTDTGQRGPGYEVSRVTPEIRAVRGYTPDEKTINPLRQLGFTTAVIAPARGVVRGTSALVSLAAANPNELIVKSDVFQHVAFETSDREERTYPGSLMGAIATVRQSFFDAQHYALDQADWQKNPQSRKRPEFDPSLEALGPAAEGKQRVLFEPGSALMVDRTARVARELKLDFAIVSCGQEWRRPDLAKETGATFIVPVDFPTLPKLPSEDDWEQVTLDNLRAWDWAAENPALLRQQQLDIALTTYSLKDKKVFRKNVRLALDRGLSETDAIAALTTVPAKLCGVDKQLGTIEPGKIANLTIVDGKGYFDPESRVREVWVDGRNYHVQSAKEVAKKEDAENGEKEAKSKAEKEKKEAELKELQNKRVARSPLEGRGVVTNPSAILVQNATVWTSSARGVLTNASVWMPEGKIQQIGAVDFSWMGSEEKIDGKNRHITPGLIDAHNHSAILGGVNEGSLPSSAMCRIGDVVNSETRNISELLAGGLTSANLLHGSANPIGGQNQIIKLREGASPEEMKFEGAPTGIKFALGENVKQSNWGDRNTTRFPQSRTGVPTFHRNRFTAAQQYLQEWQEFRTKGGVPPRRDLELETIGEIIEGKRFIHCHSYRQDEILAFLRTMESFNVRVGTLQHVLEGYKIADEIAKHGAGASCFADWWAYKFEVYDAIPYAGALMRERGVLVSFNSDSSDLARRLNTEAAKAVKYGGVPEEEALKFVTINPARQLGIDKRVGSLEPGKDADFVVWSGHPLDTRSVVLQTWIDGKKYFDRDEAAKRTAALKREREDLIAKAKKLKKLSGGGSGGDGGGGDDGSFFQVSLEHQFDGVERHCMEEGADL
ncbi:MAG TPA: amidohydrolase family protein [Verrucomicrobiae bacterium]|nr:amidohydrolase family protein [Verrucomicrobiae bacterium]